MTMSRIRISVSSFRKMLEGLQALVEVDPNDPRNPKNRKLPAQRSPSPRPREFPEPGRIDPEQMSGLPPADISNVDELTPAERQELSRTVKQQTSMGGQRQIKGSTPHNISLGKGKAQKQPPASRPVTKDYVGKDIESPYQMPTKRRVVSTEELAQKAPRAAATLPYDGEVTYRNGFYVLQPSNAVDKMMVWAEAKPPKEEPEKRMPRAWRTIEELTRADREKLGWLDTRDRAKQHQEFKPTPPKEDDRGLGVRVKGQGWDPMGGLDIGGWSDIGDPQSASVRPNPRFKGPKTGEDIMRSRLPDPRSVRDVGSLEALRDRVSAHTRSSPDSRYRTYIRAIDDEIQRRLAAAPDDDEGSIDEPFVGSDLMDVEQQRHAERLRQLQDKLGRTKK